MNAEMPIQQTEEHDCREPHTLRVTGRVRQPLVLSMEELLGMDTEELEDLPIICGSGTPKGRIAKCTGVLLENVIKKAEVLREEHNDTKKMYIVASSGDGFKVVFSWQEIFNTPIGGGVMILIEKDGTSLCTDGARPDLISAEDYYTGSRYVRGLERIELVLVE
ncbi:MAG: molybdopterin-dependent oxidoreductase [Syntrophobacter sp.]